MKVFKFGGASISTVERFRQVASIIRAQDGKPILLVVSAMGKTTNALESVVRAFCDGNTQQALQLFAQVKDSHTQIAKYLLVTTYNETLQRLQDFFTEVEWLLHDRPVREFDYYYDQIVCSGELFSSAILSAFLREEKIPNAWMDVRDILRTDNNFREAAIDWEYSRQQVEEQLKPELNRQGLVVTQGFIGATDANESTTLGREGSDYSAAVFANMLDAESQTIWKDVEGVMNADPKQFPDAEIIRELGYEEVIEMAYYGAQVIHPRTIQPLQQKKIPLLVKCFLDASLPGTVIHTKSSSQLPPIYVVKQKQVLVHLRSRDFSFVGERPVGQLYHWLEELRFRPNLVQSGAVSVELCLDDQPEKIEKLGFLASDIFDVQVRKGLSLLSIRHYRPGIAENMTVGKEILLRQQSPQTIQVLYAEPGATA